jgi:hypothetical protein
MKEANNQFSFYVRVACKKNASIGRNSGRDSFKFLNIKAAFKPTFDPPDD